MTTLSVKYRDDNIVSKVQGMDNIVSKVRGMTTLSVKYREWATLSVKARCYQVCASRDLQWYRGFWTICLCYIYASELRYPTAITIFSKFSDLAHTNIINKQWYYGSQKLAVFLYQDQEMSCIVEREICGTECYFGVTVYESFGPDITKGNCRMFDQQIKPLMGSILD